LNYYNSLGYKVYDINNIKDAYFGVPLVLPVSYTDYYWCGKMGSGSLKYYIRGGLDDIEVVDLENSWGVDFVLNDSFDDTLYYYNYADPNSGMIRYHKYNKQTIKDNSPLSFDTSYKMQGYLNKLYFGKYNSV